VPSTSDIGRCVPGDKRILGRKDWGVTRGGNLTAIGGKVSVVYEVENEGLKARRARQGGQGEGEEGETEKTARLGSGVAGLGGRHVVEGAQFREYSEATARRMQLYPILMIWRLINCPTFNFQPLYTLLRSAAAVQSTQPLIGR